mgnify:CR=1 FL=1
MKPWYKSKSVWFGVGVVLPAVAQYLESVPGLPNWVLVMIGAAIVALRIITTQPLAPPTKPGGGKIGPVSIVILALVMVGCAANWPKACDLTDSVHQCRCSDLTFKITKWGDRSKPAGRIEMTCDGVKLPATIVAHDIGVPACQD